VQTPGTPFDRVPAGQVHFVLAHSKTPSVDVLKRDNWIVDSGATVHIVNGLNLLTDPVIYDVPQPLTLATTDATAEIIAAGDVGLYSGNGCIFTLRNVKCVPCCKQSIVCVSNCFTRGSCSSQCKRRT
jgi:hypothetical protein